jgi:hypothetical protein
MAGATVYAAGDLTAGVQVKGAVKQYGYSGQNDSSSSLETITPYDSGTILGTTPPGKAGIKLVSGVVQRAQAALLCGSTSGNVGNALVSSYNLVGSGAAAGFDGLPTKPVGTTVADGLSLSENHE